MRKPKTPAPRKFQKFDVLVGKWSGKTKRPLLGPGEPLDLIQTEEARHKLALYSGRRAGVR